MNTVALPLPRISELVGEVAGRILKPENLDGPVIAESALDSESRDAVRITIVIKPDAFERIEDDDILKTLVGVGHRLDEAGEERTPLIEYATRAELEDLGDTEL